MDQREQKTDAEPRQLRPAKLLDERKQHAAKDEFLRDGREHDGENAQVNPRRPQRRAQEQFHGRLRFPAASRFFAARFRKDNSADNTDRQNDDEGGHRPGQGAEKIHSSQSECVAPVDLMQPQENRNQNPRRALKSQRRDQKVSEIVLVPEAVDAGPVQQRGGENAQAKAQPIAPRKTGARVPAATAFLAT